jgi:S-methylmethionine-dependent homocysteine/selenocysteine methylase
MTRYRARLPQLDGGRYLTDSGFETTLVFRDRMELPCFAAFPLLGTIEGRNRTEQYYRQHIDIARKAGAGFILESPTWRANPDWGNKLGYNETALRAANVEAIELMRELQQEFDRPQAPFVVSGNVGPRGDGYNPGSFMSVKEARDYHAWQVGIFADSGADFVSAFTMNYANEATGAVLAAKAARIPVAISFTVETDGRLPSEQPLGDAIAEVEAATGAYAAYFMINCAHPDHFDGAIDGKAPWAQRILGVRANASRRSHAELDEATELDDGNPDELAGQYRQLARALPRLRVFGGCCGTDHRHVAAIAFHCLETA